MSACSPCAGLFLFVLPCFGTLHDGRTDQVSFSWAACGAVLWAAVPLGNWTTCLEVLCWLAAPSPGRAWCGGYILTGGIAVSPQQRRLGVLSDLPAGIHRAELKPVTSETAWAFPHLTAACLVVAYCTMPFTAGCSCALQCQLWLHGVISSFLFDCWLLALFVLVKSFTVPRRR